MKKRGRNVRDAATAAGVSPSTIRRWAARGVVASWRDESTKEIRVTLGRDPAARAARMSAAARKGATRIRGEVGAARARDMGLADDEDLRGVVGIGIRCWAPYGKSRSFREKLQRAMSASAAELTRLGCSNVRINRRAWGADGSIPPSTERIVADLISRSRLRVPSGVRTQWVLKLRRGGWTPISHAHADVRSARGEAIDSIARQIVMRYEAERREGRKARRYEKGRKRTRRKRR